PLALTACHTRLARPPYTPLSRSAYWDFIDHHVALTERSLTEAASAAGFDVEHLVPRFLPYTTKSRVLDVETSGARGLGEAPLGQDRKSTRLNSSHEWRSYAVFCL